MFSYRAFPKLSQFFQSLEPFCLIRHSIGRSPPPWRLLLQSRFLPHLQYGKPIRFLQRIQLIPSPKPAKRSCAGEMGRISLASAYSTAATPPCRCYGGETSFTSTVGGEMVNTLMSSGASATSSLAGDSEASKYVKSRLTRMSFRVARSKA